MCWNELESHSCLHLYYLSIFSIWGEWVGAVGYNLSTTYWIALCVEVEPPCSGLVFNSAVVQHIRPDNVRAATNGRHKNPSILPSIYSSIHPPIHSISAVLSCNWTHRGKPTNNGLCLQNNPLLRCIHTNTPTKLAPLSGGKNCDRLPRQQRCGVTFT